MPDNIYVAGFPYKTTKEELARIFSACGVVVSSKVIMDRETGRPAGFGFIEMSTPAEVKAAVSKLNGTDLGGRKLFVVEARPQKERPAGSRPTAAPAARAPRPGEPGFVERRSGKDRRGGGSIDDRRAVPAPAPAASAEKSWKPFGKKPFEKKTWDKKPFGKKTFKKPWSKSPSEPKPVAKTAPPLRGQKWFPKKD